MACALVDAPSPSCPSPSPNARALCRAGPGPSSFRRAPFPTGLRTRCRGIAYVERERIVRCAAVNTTAEQRSCVVVTVDKPGMFTRALFAGVDIDTPCEVVWRCLTGYDDLGTFIPSLAVNRCLQKFSNGCRLEQVGEQDVALGAKFKARVVLSIHEYEGGVPKSQLAEDKEPFPLPRSPIPESVSRPRDITFEQVEGDFVCFKGVWRMQQGTSPDTTCLSYSVLVTPQVWLPVGLVEGRISAEIRRNLTAVKQHAERTYSKARVASAT